MSAQMSEISDTGMPHRITPFIDDIGSVCMQIRIHLNKNINKTRGANEFTLVI